MSKAAFIALALAFVSAAGPSAPALLLREQAWTAPGDDFAHAMTHAPGECLARRTAETEIGRALFRAPALLGGPAARAGLSCNSCHSNGRVNGRFLLPELTDRAGHADVTSEWASRTLGDGVANPIPIPDLVGASTHASFGRHNLPSLEDFVSNVIEREFQGAPPPPQAFNGVIAYVRALEPSACPTLSETAITLTSAADDVRRAVAAARGADPATASLLLLAAQDGMGRIVERLPRRNFSRDRQMLESLSRDLGAARDSAETGAALDELAWSARFDAAISRLARRERRSYFNEATLGAARVAAFSP